MMMRIVSVLGIIKHTMIVIMMTTTRSTMVTGMIPILNIYISFVYAALMVMAPLMSRLTSRMYFSCLLISPLPPLLSTSSGVPHSRVSSAGVRDVRRTEPLAVAGSQAVPEAGVGHPSPRVGHIPPALLSEQGRVLSHHRHDHPPLHELYVLKLGGCLALPR